MTDFESLVYGINANRTISSNNNNNNHNFDDTTNFKYAPGRRTKPNIVKFQLFSPELLKFLYLTCSVFISTTIIVECILIQLVIRPYLAESVFLRGYCKFNTSEVSLLTTCENKCSKERSHFPCLRLKVLYTPMRETNATGPMNATLREDANASSIKWIQTNETRSVFLYDSFTTYSSFSKLQCSNAPCSKREADNNKTVNDFKKKLIDKEFECYAKPYDNLTKKELEMYRDKHALDTDDSERDKDKRLEVLEEEHHKILEVDGNPQLAAALLHLNFSSTMFFHCVFWPLFLLVGSSLMLLLLYLYDGCKVWRSDDYSIT